MILFLLKSFLFSTIYFLFRFWVHSFLACYINSEYGDQPFQQTGCLLSIDWLLLQHTFKCLSLQNAFFISEVLTPFLN